MTKKSYKLKSEFNNFGSTHFSHLQQANTLDHSFFSNGIKNLIHKVHALCIYISQNPQSIILSWLNGGMWLLSHLLERDTYDSTPIASHLSPFNEVESVCLIVHFYCMTISQKEVDNFLIFIKLKMWRKIVLVMLIYIMISRMKK